MRAAYPVALSFGLVFAVALLSPAALAPADPLHTAFVGDEAVSVVGQRDLIAAAWSWPPLRAPQLEAPAGLNVGLTDSIPLATLAAKLARRLLPAGSFVQVWWVALMLALQPVAAVYALRGTGERRAIPAAAVAVLSVSMPTLLIRFGHMALCSHPAILAALGLYLRLVRRPRTADWALAAALAVACLLVHPYILALVLAVLAAVPATLLLRRDRRWLPSAACLLAIAAGAAGLGLLLGFGGTQPAPGFGYYSMNLFGPLLPSFSGLFPDLAVDATGGQAREGYQYLGAGLLPLAAVAAILALRRLGWRRHAGLALVLTGLAVFALSNKVYAGHRLLLDWGSVPPSLAQFRSTGRFFWPVGYAVLVAAVAAVARWLRPGPAVALLLAAAALQWQDTAPLRAGIAAASRHGAEWAIDAPTLRPIFAAHSRVVLWPPFGCGATATDDVPIQVMLLASETGMATNTMFSARTRTDADCDPNPLLAHPLPPGTLLALTHPGDRWLVPESDTACRRSTPLILCSTQPIPLPPAPDVTLPAGEDLRLPDPRLAQALGHGWSIPTDAVWSDGPEATLRFRHPPGPAILTLRLLGFAPTAGGQQIVNVTMDGHPAATWSVPDQQDAMVHLPLPATPGPTTITLHIATPTTPATRNGTADTRHLGVLLRGLRIDPG